MSLLDRGGHVVPLGKPVEPDVNSERGRGFQLMNKLMDEVRVRSYPAGGTRVSMLRSWWGDADRVRAGMRAAVALAAVLAALWAVLVWELCTSTRVIGRHLAGGRPGPATSAHAPLFGVLRGAGGAGAAAGGGRRARRPGLRAVPAPDGAAGRPSCSRPAPRWPTACSSSGEQAGIPGRRGRRPGRARWMRSGALGVPWALASRRGCSARAVVRLRGRRASRRGSAAA